MKFVGFDVLHVALVELGAVGDVLKRYATTGLAVEVAVKDNKEMGNVDVAGRVKLVMLGAVADIFRNSFAPTSQTPVAGLVVPMISQLNG